MTTTTQSEQGGDQTADKYELSDEQINKIEDSECPECGKTLGIDKTELDAEGAEIDDATYHIYRCGCGFVVEQRMTPDSYKAGVVR